MKLSKKIIAMSIMSTSILVCSSNIVANAAQKEDVNSSYDTAQTSMDRSKRVPVAFRWVVEVTSGSGAAVYSSPGGGHEVVKLTSGAKVLYGGETREVNGEKWYKISENSYTGWVSEHHSKLYYILI
ncbi:hypothetical protein GCM10008904_30080 [Paraclostridium ghonii]|uniref:SH3b domain-containing protein n=1 Tax=Paraclostridium ghonii TaxID=29358 RepID=A0ABU0MYA6_9FIRM|nr:SLAP domain-containing protein [Paeniclostridium ghonii]MDQ0555589.1 hypothetical protein [Paeniclostridium ghonii]